MLSLIFFVQVFGVLFWEYFSLSAALQRLLSAGVAVRPSDSSSYSLTWYRVKKGQERILLTPDLCKYLSPLTSVSDAPEAIVALAFSFCIEKLYLERALETRRRRPELSWSGQLAEVVRRLKKEKHTH